jgi:hypothetical protein
MAEIMKPFELLWDWVDRTGGYPGKVLFGLLVVMLILGLLTWFTNKK